MISIPFQGRTKDIELGKPHPFVEDFYEHTLGIGRVPDTALERAYVNYYFIKHRPVSDGPVIDEYLHALSSSPPEAWHYALAERCYVRLPPLAQRLIRGRYPRIVVIDDHERAGHLVSGRIASVRRFSAFTRPSGSVEHIVLSKPDVILVSANIADASPVTLLFEIRARQIIARQPVSAVIVYGEPCSMFAMERYRSAGLAFYVRTHSADDWLTSRLVPAVRRVIRNELAKSSKDAVL